MATTHLVLQAPGAGTESTLSTVLKRLEGAQSGGALFAWTNKAGITALLHSTAFGQFIRDRAFELVVGSDSITDPRALSELTELNNDTPNLKIRIFVHDQAVLFHPKFIWLEEDEGLRLIVGSGNLTRGGLEANWEALTDSLLDGEEADAARNQIATWLADNRRLLFDPTDEQAIEAVRANAGNERSIRQRHVTPANGPAVAVPASNESGAVKALVAELPRNRKITRADSPFRGSSMFSQANFKRELFQDFFRAPVGTELHLYFVEDDGSLRDMETRTARTKSSHNYYFEIGAASGLPHPADAHPIAVFVRVTSGAFLYTFRLPGDPGYAELDIFLASSPQGREGELRRQTLDPEELRRVWPRCPLLVAAEPGT